MSIHQRKAEIKENSSNSQFNGNAPEEKVRRPEAINLQLTSEHECKRNLYFSSNVSCVTSGQSIIDLQGSILLVLMGI